MDSKGIFTLKQLRLKFKEHYNPYVNLGYEKGNLSISSKDQEHTQVKGGRPFQLLQHCNISEQAWPPHIGW
jgi:hypothetical protein